MSDESRPRLRVVNGEAQASREVRVWRCPVCLAAGRSSRAVLSVYFEAYEEGGRITPGEPALACLSCHARGIVTLV